MYFHLFLVVARAKAWTVFAGSNTAIVVSNPFQGMGVCVRLFCVCVVMCVGSGLETDWSPVQGTYRLCRGSRNWKSGQSPQGLQSHRQKRVTRRHCVVNAWTHCVDRSVFIVTLRNGEFILTISEHIIRGAWPVFSMALVWILVSTNLTGCRRFLFATEC
jgi:hypothetical protein